MYHPSIYAALSSGVCFNDDGAASSCLLTSYLPVPAGRISPAFTADEDHWGAVLYLWFAQVGINGHGSGDVREGEAPTGVIVGTAIVSHCERENGHYCWHLSEVTRLQHPRKPKRQPQPVWFRPF